MSRDWLRIIRKEACLTQKDVAKRARLSQGYYADIENGNKAIDNKIPFDTAKRIASVLGFDWIKFYQESQHITEKRKAAHGSQIDTSTG